MTDLSSSHLFPVASQENRIPGHKLSQEAGMTHSSYSSPLTLLQEQARGLV